MINIGSVVTIKYRTDHKGKVFESAVEMCKYWNIPYNIYVNRIRLGWSKKKALATPISRNFVEDNRTDHLGNIFKSKKEMCKYWDISIIAYEKRIKKGMGKEEALTSKKKTYSEEQDRTDHLGNVFNSIAQMCKYWNITNHIYTKRINDGWTKEQALTFNIKQN